MEHREISDGPQILTTFQECLENMDFDCIKLKLARNFRKLLSLRSFKLFEGVELERLPSQDLDSPTEDQSVNDEDNLLSARNTEQQGFAEVILNGMSELFQKSVVKVDIYPGLNARIWRSEKPTGLFQVSLQQNTAAEGNNISSFLLITFLFYKYRLHLNIFILTVF